MATTPSGYRPDSFPPLRDCRRERDLFRAVLDVGTVESLALDGAHGDRAALAKRDGNVPAEGLGLCVDVGGDLTLVRVKDVSSPIVRALLGPKLVVTVAPLYVAMPPREMDAVETEAARHAERLRRYTAEARAEHAAWKKAYRERCARRHAEEKGEAGAREAAYEDSDGPDDADPIPPSEHAGA